MFQKVREGDTTLNRLMLIHAWLAWYAEKTPGGLLFVGERGKPFRRSTFGREWRKARSVVGLPADVRFYDLRHTGHTLTTRLGATLKDTVVRVGSPWRGPRSSISTRTPSVNVRSLPGSTP